jgi:indole-3-glycerol phosphate synthase
LRFPLTEHLPNSKISRTSPETQANPPWKEPSGTLGELVRNARERADAARSQHVAAAGSVRRSFEAALRGNEVAIIAEVKRRSPSRGDINPGIDPLSQARAYERGGASALSVLTEPSRFGGKLADLVAARSHVTIPALRKDFIVTESQLAEAAAAGADAALLIVRAIEPSRLRQLASAGRDLGLDLLFEVRDEIELDAALSADARIVGVNNRNLETLEVDPATVERILPGIPREILAVAESGYASRSDVERAAEAGADAVLVGSFVSAAPDPEAAVSLLTGVGKVPRKS